MLWKYIAIVLVGYLMGSLNPAIILSQKVLGADIRTFGSGNPGTTNVQRTMGSKWAAAVALLDISKTAFAILFAQFLCYGFDFDAGMLVRLIAGTAAVIGHIWPVFYRFKGGKGVMTAAATALFFHPLLFLCCLLAFVIIVALTRYISLGSMVSSLIFPLMLFAFYPDRTVFKVIALLIPLIIVVKHRTNIIRLFNHNENKLKLKK